MLKLQNFGKMLETRVLRAWQICLPHRQYKDYRRPPFIVTSTTRIFLSTVLLPMLCAEAAGGVRLFRGCLPGPGSSNDHAGPHRTSRNTPNSVSRPQAHQTRGGLATPPLAAHSAAPHSLETAASFSPRPATSPYLWRTGSFTHHGAVAKLTRLLPTVEPKAQHTGQLPTSTGNKLSQKPGSQECPPIYLTGGSARGSDWRVRPD